MSIRLFAAIAIAGAIGLAGSGWHTHLAAQASAVAAAADASAPRGRTIYLAHCVECHGADGKGDGPAAHLLTPRPRDFTLARYKIRSTETGSLPTDDDILRSIRQGLYGTAMPGWQQLLPDADLRALVAYVKTLSPRFAREAPEPILPPPAPPVTPARVAHGAVVYQTLQCGKCHGLDGRGTGATATAFEDDWRQPIEAADLTEPWTFRGGATSDDVYMRFRAGMSGTPMPSFKDNASDDDMRDLAAFVVSLGRKPVWMMSAGETAALLAKQDSEARANPVKRGQHLVRTLGCALCHSPLDRDKRLLPGLLLAGGLTIRVDPFGVYPTGNLTSDKETGLGNWTDDEIKRVLTRGTLRDGTRLLPYPMDWGSFSLLKDEDLNAIVAYLRTVPAVRNKVPPPSYPLLPVYLWGKFKMLILGGDPPMTFYSGNAGSAGGGR